MFFKDKKEVLEFFDILENVIFFMKGKEKVFDFCIFFWNVKSIDIDEILIVLLFIIILYFDEVLKNKVMKYIKEIDIWNRGYYLEVLFEKLSNKE